MVSVCPLSVYVYTPTPALAQVRSRSLLRGGGNPRCLPRDRLRDGGEAARRRGGRSAIAVVATRCPPARQPAGCVWSAARSARVASDGDGGLRHVRASPPSDVASAQLETHTNVTHPPLERC